MANYEVGGIELNIKTLSTQTLISINETTSALRKMATQVKNLENVDLRKTYNAISSLTRAITPFIDKIVSSAEPLRNFSNALDFSKFDYQAKKGTAEINSLNAKLEKTKAQTSFIRSKEVLNSSKIAKSNVQLEIAKNKLNNINEKNKELKASFSQAFNVAKLFMAVNFTKRIASGFANILSKAIDFNETLNKFQVSMGSNYSQSLLFVDSITKAFNLSSESVMNYMSTFKNMLSALGGLSEQTSYNLSETLTRMATDYASLFNVSVEKSMTQFQSVLSGQIRSVRTTSGYDVSENSIFRIYQELGGTKTMRQLDQVEKRILRIIALQQQMENTGAVNDYSKTINQVSNELKSLAETFKEIGMWVGQLLLVYFKPLIEYALGFAVALREMAKSLAIAKGYVAEDFGEGGLFGGVEDSANAASEAIDNLNNKMLGFDKLNILGTASSNPLNPDYEFLTKELKKYSQNLDDVTNKASQIGENMLKWLGFSKQLNADAKTYTWHLQEGNTNLKMIFDTLKVIGSFIASMLIVQKLSGIFITISAIGGLLGGGIMVTIGLVAVAIGTVVALMVDLYNNSEDFRNIMDSIGQLLLDDLSVLWADFQELITSMKPLYETLKPFLEWVVGIFVGALGVILDIIIRIFDYSAKINIFFIEGVKNLFNKQAWVEGFEAIKNWFDKYIIKPVKDFFGTIFNTQNWISGLKHIGNFVISIFEGILNGAIKIINDFTGSLSGVWSWTGIPQIPKIPDVKFNAIPMLASGGVITSPTMAMVGEYQGANNNPEIVSPQSIMLDTFQQATLPLAQAILSSNKEVIKAIEDNGDKPVYLNGRKVSENIYGDLENVAIRKGKIMFG